MEQQEDILGNDWQVDDEVKYYLHQTSVLAKYVAMLGMLFALLTTGKTLYNLIRLIIRYGDFAFNAYFFGAIIGALLAGAVYFVISLFTHRFAVKLQLALKTTDQSSFYAAWQQFKMAYRMKGIVFIIYLLFMLVIFIS